MDKQPSTVPEIIDMDDLFPLEANEQAQGLLKTVAAEPSSSESVAGVSIRRGIEAVSEDMIYEGLN